MKPLLNYVAVLVLSLCSAHSQNLIDLTYGNGAGDFELGADLTEGLSAGSTNLVGWVVDRHTVDCVTAQFANPSSGLRLIDLNGLPQTSGALHTTVPTTPGENYQVAFDVAGFIHFLSPNRFKVAEVSAGNVTNLVAVTGPEIAAAPIALNWDRQEFRFTASSSNSTIAFKSLMPDDASGVLLDNVSVTHIPTLGTNTLSLATLRSAIKSSGLTRSDERSLLPEVQDAERSLKRLSRKLERRVDPAVAAELQAWINELIGRE